MAPRISSTSLPQYAISIALMKREMITQGVIYDPNRDELFTASRGRGAFLNDRRIRVSKRLRLQESLLGTGFPFRSVDDLDGYLELFARVSRLAAGVRRPGRLRSTWPMLPADDMTGSSNWDSPRGTAPAGALMVTEAGGLVGDFKGETEWLFGEQILAGTPRSVCSAQWRWSRIAPKLPHSFHLVDAGSRPEDRTTENAPSVVL
jgi:myo-inositol-1(or 4)-monophosphatase